jgi:hypothetical protein
VREVDEGTRDARRPNSTDLDNVLWRKLDLMAVDAESFRHHEVTGNRDVDGLDQVRGHR